MYETRPTLLVRLRDPGNEQAWEEFFKQYAGLTYSFSRQLGCSAEMAEEVVQESMLRMVRVFPKFEYAPDRGKFRSFFLRIVRWCVYDVGKRHGKHAPEVAMPADLASGEPAADDELSARWEQAWQQHLVKLALPRLRERVNEQTYQSFVEHAVNGRPAAEVGAELGISENVVFQHRNRLLKMLRQEVNLLEYELENG